MTRTEALRTARQIIDGELNISRENQARFARAARQLIDDVIDENEFHFIVRDSKIAAYNA